MHEKAAKLARSKRFELPALQRTVTIIPESDFYRNIPLCFEPVMRLRHEALIFASDCMEVSLSRLHAMAIEADFNRLSRAQKIAFFIDAWTIVDQIHVTRQVLRRITGDDRLSDTAAYLADFEVATLMRNDMDHLDNKIPLRAKSKSARTPLFGTLSFFKPSPESFEEGIKQGEVKGDIVILMTGSAPREIAGVVSFKDFRIQLPISNLRLEAFDRTIDLDLGVWRLRPILNRFAETTKKGFDEQAGRISEKTGIPIEKLSETGNIDLTMVFQAAMRVDNPGI